MAAGGIVPYRSLKQQRAMWARRKADQKFHAMFKKHAQRRPSVVIIHGNPQYVEGADKERADRFYRSLERAFLARNYKVSHDAGAPYTTPRKADVWVGHSRGVDRLRFAPKGTKTVAIGSPLLGSLNHPRDRPAVGKNPTAAHYRLTQDMREKLFAILEGQEGREKTAEYAPGIPSKTRIVPIKQHEGRGHLTVHEHHAHRAGKHFDVRVSLGDQDAHSWATRRMPEPGETVLAKQQPTHTRQYMDWTGEIKKGYGAGKVGIHQKGDVHVVESGPGKIVFNRYEGKKAHEYVLVRPRESQPRDWLLMNRTTRHGQYGFPQHKIPYRETDVTPELANRPGVLQPKVDGAHALVVLQANKRPRVFSYRESKRGDVLEYTHKIPGLFSQRVPTGFGNKILRAEVFLSDKKGLPLPAERTAGVLNSGIERAHELQKGTGGLRIMPFEIVGDNRPYSSRIGQIEEMARKMPFLQAPETARTPKEKERLVQQILTGRHPQTKEGIVHRDEQGNPTKAKMVHDTDVYVRKVYKGEGKHQNRAGGFYYSLMPGGPIVGKVGSGLSDRDRQELWRQRHDPTGRVASIVYEKRTGRGSLYAPRFNRWHPDKDEPPMNTQGHTKDASALGVDRRARILQKLASDLLMQPGETGPAFVQRQIAGAQNRVASRDAVQIPSAPTMLPSEKGSDFVQRQLALANQRNASNFSHPTPEQYARAKAFDARPYQSSPAPGTANLTPYTKTLR